MQQSYTCIPGSPSLPTLQQPGQTGLVWVWELLLSSHPGKPGGTGPPQPLDGGFHLPVVGSRVLPACQDMFRAHQSRRGFRGSLPALLPAPVQDTAGTLGMARVSTMGTVAATPPPAPSTNTTLPSQVLWACAGPYRGSKRGFQQPPPAKPNRADTVCAVRYGNGVENPTREQVRYELSLPGC